MPFNSAIRNISPLAWLVGVSCCANVVVAVAALYVLFGNPKVYVVDGSIDVTPRSGLRINDQEPIRVKIAK